MKPAHNGLAAIVGTNVGADVQTNVCVSPDAGALVGTGVVWVCVGMC